MTLLDTVKARGVIRRGDKDETDVKELQAALYAAGYRVNVDGIFADRTDQVVRAFQKQHGLRIDGAVGTKTAGLLLSTPPDVLIARATPVVKMTAFNFEVPHDDTASLIAFFGDPRQNLEAWKRDHVVTVECPWTLYYEGKKWPHPIQFHKRGAAALKQALDTIWAATSKDDNSPLLRHVRNFSGSGEFRSVRGSSRLSTHALWAAIDFDAEKLPLAHGVSRTEMPEEVVNAFIASGFFWGGNYTGRKDPMHFQYAHE